jgi:transposase
MNPSSSAAPPPPVLFDLDSEDPVPPKPTLPSGTPRVRHARRQQVEMRCLSLDQLLPAEHPVRVVWQYVQQLDLAPLYVPIRAVEGHAGRTPADPPILVALWLFATLEGIGSARRLNKLCVEQLPYEWLRGGVSVNYHTLADFRVGHGEFLDQLLTTSVAALLHEELVPLQRVAVDGMRVRASAGAASFRRRATLEECLAEAEAQVQQLRAEVDSDPAASSRRQHKAQQRAAEERCERVRQALAHLPAIEAKKKADEKQKARSSTTDAEARVMKMADGGFRPAFNVQLATDTATQIITGVDVTNQGSDQGQLAPMMAQHEQRYGTAPGAALVDGGFVTLEDIETVSANEVETTVYAPVPQPKDETRDPHTPLADDQPAVAAWRERMGTDPAKEIYKERAATAECVNAQARNRGLAQFRVRGLVKVKAVVLWYVLAHNLRRIVALRAEAAQKGAEE